ncbi:MAG: FAD-binding oxidoreductase [Myxococcota bacterium]
MNLDRLRSVVAVSVDAAERIAHARDLWPRGTLALAGAGPLPPSPEAVAWPRNAEEIAACLAWAEAEGVAIVPYGAGSGVCGAAAGRSGSLVVDLKRMNRIGAIEGDTVICQPGVLGQHLEDTLERAGRATRHSPSSIWCSTVGGWAASRSAGQFSSKYGKFEDMVLGMQVVAPAGRFGTGVWAQGEDLGPWVMGAEGSLGIISELLVRTVPVPTARRFAAWRFPTVEAAWEAMRALLQADLHPAVLRLYDPVDTRIAGKGSATKAKAGAGWLHEIRKAAESVPALRSHLLSLPLALPRLLNALAQGISSGCVLIAGWEGQRDVIDVLAAHGAALLSAGEPLGEELGEHWYAHRHEVSYKSAPIFERGGFADTMEVATTWSRLPALYDGVRAALGRHTLVMAHFSHVYREGCSIYFSFAGVGRLEVYDATWRDALAAAAEAGGTVAHHHGVGQLKMAAAARELAGISPRFHALKARLDPAGILNPGRLFPVVEVPEPAAPPLGVDPISQIATLDAQQPAAARDAWLAAEGWELRFPSPASLAASVGAPRRPWESRVLGASARLDGRRAVFVAVPRSSAGPDPREALPPDTYETLTVPVVRRDELVCRVQVPANVCLAADLRPARDLGATVEFRGPAAADLASLALRLVEGSSDLAGVRT